MFNILNLHCMFQGAAGRDDQTSGLYTGMMWTRLQLVLLLCPETPQEVNHRNLVRLKQMSMITGTAVSTKCLFIDNVQEKKLKYWRNIVVMVNYGHSVPP